MHSFLASVVDDIFSKFNSFEDVVFVLPSNRSIRTTRKILAQKLNAPIFSPRMVSVEQLMTQISGLSSLSEIEQQLELYTVYQTLNAKEQDTFSGFRAWSNMALGDFNEIDRYLVNPQKLFNHVVAIERIKNWNPNTEQTTLILNYTEFSKKLAELYSTFKRKLLTKENASQGLHYRIASDKIEQFAIENSHIKFLFIGLNALNEAEKLIIDQLLQHSNSQIYWDLDQHFYRDSIHEAGYFIRKNHTFFAKHADQQNLKSNRGYLEKHHISITGTPKNNSQAQLVGKILRNIHNTEKPIALVLADETLLPLVLNALPKNIEAYNVSMGYPLNLTQTAKFLISVLRLNQNQTEKGYYHKDILSFLSLSTTNQLIEKSLISSFTKNIKSDNIIYIKPRELKEELGEGNPTLLFLDSPKPKTFISTVFEILQILSNKTNTSLLEKEAISQFHQFFSDYESNLEPYVFLNQFKSLESLLIDFINKGKINFKGNPDQGLQIMGLLETRALDFETVIMTSLNEGILPAGKSVNSFIPYDIKKEYDLPTVKEKDAIYAYHFYRLLQGAKNVYLTYNTEPDILNTGEPSRFIHQIITDPKLKPFVSHQFGAPKLKYQHSKKKIIRKTPLLHQELIEKVQSGLSPSSLSNYIKNPYVFYKKHILKINESEDVDESIAYNVLGTIVHDSLESLYKSLPKGLLNPKDLNLIISQIESHVLFQFEKHYNKKSIFEGKNLIVYNVIQKYVSSVIEKDKTMAEKSNFKIVALEETLNAPIKLDSLAISAKIKGKLDRIDKVDGKTRIIDYKTGNVSESGITIDAIESLFSEAKYSPSFQLMCYVLMKKKAGITVDEAGILPIKKPSQGLLLLKAQKGMENPCSDIVLDTFESRLKLLYEEILNPDIPFEDTGE